MPKEPTDPVIGYLYAVLVASLVFISLSVVGHVGRHMLGQNPLGVVHLKIFLLIALGILLGVSYAAAAPVFLIHQVARRLSISSVWYYVTCGAVTGFLLGSPLMLLLLDDPYGRGVQTAARNAAMYAGSLCMLSGAAGGLVYWHLIGRFVGRQTSVP